MTDTKTKPPPIENCKRVSIAAATKPRNGLFQVYVDFWWSVTPQEEILFYTKGGGNSPQCNSGESCCEHFTKRLYPDCTIKQISVVYVECHPSEFMN